MSQSELTQARTEAELDFEVEERVAKKRKEKKKGEKKTPGHGWEEDWASLYGEGISGKLPRFANRITSKVFPFISTVLNFFNLFWTMMIIFLYFKQ